MKPLIEIPSTASSSTLKKQGVTGRIQAKEDRHMAVSPLNIMHLIMFVAIGEVEIVTGCANAAQICCKVVTNALDVYMSDGYVLVFLGLVSSGQAP